MRVWKGEPERAPASNRARENQLSIGPNLDGYHWSTLPFSPASGHQNHHERKTQEQQLFSLGAVPLWQAAVGFLLPTIRLLPISASIGHPGTWTEQITPSVNSFCFSTVILYCIISHGFAIVCLQLQPFEMATGQPNLNFSSRSGSPSAQGFCSWQGCKQKSKKMTSTFHLVFFW
jgi:hypothetical protein